MMVGDVQLIVRALSKHRLICALIVLQIVIACAILCNGLNLVVQRYALQNLQTGLAEDRLIVLDVNVLQGEFDKVLRDEVLAAVSAVPGVESTAYVNTLPLSGYGSVFQFLHRGEFERRMSGALYYGSPGFMKAMGVRIVAGRGFEQSDFNRVDPNPLATVDKVILSESFSRRLLAPIGSQVELGGRMLTVVGICRDVMNPALAEIKEAFDTAFIPSPPGGIEKSLIVIKADKIEFPNVTNDIVSAATAATPRALVWSARPFASIRADHFQLDRTVIRLIFWLGLLLAFVVAAGIGGLSSYWIRRRYKQIAIRRTLGARQRDIALYFHVENLLVTSVGAVFGLLGAITLSGILEKWMEMPSVPVWPMLGGALAMIAVGQFAVLLPVSRAVSVPPGAVKRP